MDSQAYWQRRQLERERKWHELTTSELRTLKRFYQKSCAEIEKEIAALYAKFARENALPPEEARRLIRGREFKQWRFTLEEYVRRSKLDPKILRELNTLAARSRISRLEAIHATTLMELADLAERLQETMDAHLARAYLDTYYRNLYDFHKTVGLITPPAQLDAKRVESVLQTAWVSKNYSERIWNNRTKLVREIKQTMLTAIHRGSSIQQLSKALARRMEVGYNDAERLVRTELNAVENRASADAMRDAEFEYYQFVATLDRRTCARCGEHDGEIYRLTEMNQGENAPPLHARCRCTIVATDDAPKGKRAARSDDGKRSRVPEDMSYRDWRAVYIEKTKSLAQWQSEIAEKRMAGLSIESTSGKVAPKENAMSAGDTPKWPPRDKSKIILKEEYVKLRELAEANDIALSGVKKFDGSAEVVRQVIEILIELKNIFPAVSDARHKLELNISTLLGAQDYAETLGRMIKLNAAAWRDVNLLQIEYQKDVADGWFVKGTDWRAIPHHEFGHVVANVYKLDPLKIACEVTGLKPKATLDYLDVALSKYAGGFVNGCEIISEVFADISTGSPCEFSRKFYEKVLFLTRGDKK